MVLRSDFGNILLCTFWILSSKIKWKFYPLIKWIKFIQIVVMYYLSAIKARSGRLLCTFIKLISCGQRLDMSMEFSIAAWNKRFKWDKNEYYYIECTWIAMSIRRNFLLLLTEYSLLYRTKIKRKETRTQSFGGHCAF